MGPRKFDRKKRCFFFHFPPLRSHVIWILYCYRPETWRQCKTRHGPKTGFGENGNIENLVWLSFSSGLVWYFSLKNWFGNDLCIAYASRFLDNYEINLFGKSILHFLHPSIRNTVFLSLVAQILFLSKHIDYIT